MLTTDRPRESADVADLEARAEIAREAAAEPTVSLAEIAAGLRELADLIENDYLPERSADVAHMNLTWFAKNPDAVEAFAASRAAKANRYELEGYALTSTWVQLGGVFIHISNREITR